MKSVELFAGCGGLALGMSRAGFRHVLLVEYDKDAVSTVLHNKVAAVPEVSEWPITLEDVRGIDWGAYPTLDLVSGGPPCQPFGIGGKKLGHADHRDMWPEAIRAIREARPKAFLFENVRNLAGPKFRIYLEWIVEHLKRPSMVRASGEAHASHLDRLKRASGEPEYRVIWQVVNAADYGAAQIRFRVLIFGVRADLNVIPAPMTATHSRDRLLWEQYITGEYWDRHSLSRMAEPTLRQDKSRLAELRSLLEEPPGAPWVTVRDALAGLGEPDGLRNHIFQPGARVYPGHSGSPLDLPSKALKAGDHGVPGGENMMIRDDGSVRYFTIREAARLVGLPDEYIFPRSWTETMRQLGNAVPAPLGQAAGHWLTTLLESKQRRTGLVSRSRAA